MVDATKSILSVSCLCEHGLEILRFGDGHEPLIRKGGVYFVKAQTVNADESRVHPEDSHKWCRGPEDSPKKWCRGQEIHKIGAEILKIHGIHRVRAEILEIHRIGAEILEIHRTGHDIQEIHKIGAEIQEINRNGAYELKIHKIDVCIQKNHNNSRKEVMCRCAEELRTIKKIADVAMLKCLLFHMSLSSSKK